MRAKDVMTSPAVTVAPETTVQEIAKLLIEREISAVPVVHQDQQVLGMVSEGDLLRRVENADERHRSWWLKLFSMPADPADYVKTHGRRAADVMTRDVTTVGADTPLHEIAAILEERRIKRVPVVEDGRLVGVVSRANLLHGLAAGPATPPALAADDEAIRTRVQTALREDVGGMTGWSTSGERPTRQTAGGRSSSRPRARPASARSARTSGSCRPWPGRPYGPSKRSRGGQS